MGDSHLGPSLELSAEICGENKIPEHLLRADAKPSPLSAAPFRGPGERTLSASANATAEPARSLFDGLTAQVALLDASARIVDTNRAWRCETAQSSPFTGPLSSGADYAQYLDACRSRSAEAAEAIDKGIRSVLAGSTVEFDCEFPCPTATGTQWFHVRAVAIDNSPEGDAVLNAPAGANTAPSALAALIVSYENVSARVLAEENLRRSNAILEATQEAAAEGIFLVDKRGLVVRFNRRFVELWNIAPDEVEKLRENHMLLARVLDSLKDADEFIERIGYLYDHPEESASDVIYLKDGRVFERYSAPAVSPQGDYYGRVWSFTDITARKAAESRLAHQAFHDPLTGLPNRVLFSDRLERALARARRHNQFIAVLFLDLDRFKIINDSLGHEAGDQLLIAVGQRLRARMRPEDTAARLGGDEFTVLLEDIQDVEAAARVAERIAEDLRAPFLIGAREVFTTSSIGIALSNGVGNSPDEVMRDADAAMYLAKSRGKAHYEIFDQTLTSRALEHLELENDLRRALHRGEFELFFQPIVNLVTNELVGHEALLRWRHPTRGLTSPAEFIPIAEETGLIVAIGAWALREACSQCKVWNDVNEVAGLSAGVRMSVNLSARQFEQPDLVADVAATLRETQLAPHLLVLEITESAVMRDIDNALATLKALKQLGVGLAIDDFGTGHSSLSYLRRFPIDVLKIDRSFIAGLSEHAPEGDGAIVRAIITLAETFGVSVTAEGIETDAQLRELLQLNCPLGQGYLFAEPAAAAELDGSASLSPDVAEQPTSLK